MIKKIIAIFRYKSYLFQNKGIFFFKFIENISYQVSNLFIKIINKKFFFIIKLDDDNPRLFNSKIFTYKKYKNLQINANIRKINSSWVKKEDVKVISQLLNKNFKNKKISGLCQGTRNGSEQKFFKKYLNNSKILGTDISPTAKKFKDTIQWDFNKYKGQFFRKYDFVYSNSHDHSFNLKKTILIWLKYLKKDGYLILQNHKSHGSLNSNNLDSSSIETELLPFVIMQWTNGEYKVETFLNPKSSNSQRDKIFFINKNNN